MTKAPTPTEKFKKQHDNTKISTKNFNFIMIADWLRTDGWSNNRHPAHVVRPFYGIQTFPLTARAVYSKGHSSCFTRIVLFQIICKHVSFNSLTSPLADGKNIDMNSTYSVWEQKMIRTLLKKPQESQHVHNSRTRSIGKLMEANRDLIIQPAWL